MPDKKEIIKEYLIDGKKYYQQKLTFEQFEDMTEIFSDSLIKDITESKRSDIGMIIDVLKKQKLIRKMIPMLLIEDGKEYDSEKRVKIKFNKIAAETVMEVIRDFLSLSSSCGAIIKSLYDLISQMMPQKEEFKIPENVRTSVE